MLIRRGRRHIRKAQPTPNQVHVNVPLTNISVAYMLSTGLYVANRVFPVVPVMQQSNLFYKFDKSDFLRDEARPRAPGTESAGGGFNVTTDSYSCQVYAYHKDVDDQMRANADTVLAPDRTATEFVTQKMLLRRDKQFLSTYFKTGVWANEATPGVLWDNASAKPKTDVLNARNAVLLSTGKLAKGLLLGPYTYTALQNCPAILDQFKYTSPESVTTATLAKYFDVDEVIVALAPEATNIEGAAFSSAFLAGKHALLYYKEQSPSLMTPSAGYIMSWNAYAGSAQGATITKFRMQQLRSDRVEGEFAYDMKVVAADCGYFFNNCVS